MNFCYADFKSAFTHCAAAYQELTRTADNPKKIHRIEEAGLEFQQCGRCGKYFIVKGNYHGAYCDRIADGEHRTCQQLAAQETYLEKLKDNGGKNALSVYQKYYKRYFRQSPKRSSQTG